MLAKDLIIKKKSKGKRKDDYDFDYDYENFNFEKLYIGEESNLEGYNGRRECLTMGMFQD